MASKLFNKTKLFVAIWPDKTFTIVNASSKSELFWKLDEEGDPALTEIRELEFEDDKIHIQCPWPDGSDGEVGPLVYEGVTKNKTVKL